MKRSGKFEHDHGVGVKSEAMGTAGGMALESVFRVYLYGVKLQQLHIDRLRNLFLPKFLVKHH
jgi:hypothetical protein